MAALAALVAGTAVIGRGRGAVALLGLAAHGALLAWVEHALIAEDAGAPAAASVPPVARAHPATLTPPP
eukprot:6478367-Prymnesium_polylepis.1